MRQFYFRGKKEIMFFLCSRLFSWSLRFYSAASKHLLSEII